MSDSQSPKPQQGWWHDPKAAAALAAIWAVTTLALTVDPPTDPRVLYVMWCGLPLVWLLCFLWVDAFRAWLGIRFERGSMLRRVVWSGISLFAAVAYALAIWLFWPQPIQPRPAVLAASSVPSSGNSAPSIPSAEPTATAPPFEVVPVAPPVVDPEAEALRTRVRELERRLSTVNRESAARDEAKRDAYEVATKALLNLVSQTPNTSCLAIGAGTGELSSGERNFIEQIPELRAAGGGLISRIIAADGTERLGPIQTAFDAWEGAVRANIQNRLGIVAAADFMASPSSDAVLVKMDQDARAKMSVPVSNRVGSGTRALLCLDAIDQNLRKRNP